MGKQETIDNVDWGGPSYGYTITEAPSAMLRWRDQVLEQRWHITHYKDGRVVHVEDEWRPVPALNEDSGE